MLLNHNQKQIIDLIRKGLTNEGIAKRLLISSETVKKRITELYELTECPNRASLINYAWENNLIPQPDFTNRSVKVDGPKQFK